MICDICLRQDELYIDFCSEEGIRLNVSKILLKLLPFCFEVWKIQLFWLNMKLLKFFRLLAAFTQRAFDFKKFFVVFWYYDFHRILILRRCSSNCDFKAFFDFLCRMNQILAMYVRNVGQKSKYSMSFICKFIQSIQATKLNLRKTSKMIWSLNKVMMVRFGGVILNGAKMCWKNC